MQMCNNTSLYEHRDNLVVQVSAHICSYQVLICVDESC